MAWTHAGREVAVAFDVSGQGPDALFLPAFSSISTRKEMRPLASRFSGRHRCFIPDWPGFGDAPRASVPLSPETLRTFLRAFIERQIKAPAIGVAAGHAAPYLVESAHATGAFERLILVAPTWRGPLPTVMGEARRPLYARIRRAIELPAFGQFLYRLNVSRPVVAKMMRAHVYADPAKVEAAVLRAKLSVTRQSGARFGTAAFVTGGLDPVESRAEFLALFDCELPPTLVIRPISAPPKSAAEMDALAASGRTELAEVPGALAAHEEHPDAVAQAIKAFLDRTAPQGSASGP